MGKKLYFQVVGYCWYHKRNLTEEDIKYKNCKFKPNTRCKCKYLQYFKKNCYENLGVGREVD